MFARGLTLGLAAALTLSAAGQGLAADADMKAIKEKMAPAAATPAKPASIFLFSDTQVSYRHVFTAAEPGIPKLKTLDPSDGRDIPKNVLNISHADAFAYGTNFFSLDILKSGTQDPAGTRNEVPGQTTLFGYGATEAYGLYRGTLSLNKISGTNYFAIPGIVKDVSLSYGGDVNTKNTAFGPNKHLVVGGLVFSIDVPIGFLNVAVHASHEWNRNGFAIKPFREVEFETTPEFEIVYSIPLDSFFGGFPIKLAGFNNIVMPKGRVSSPLSARTNTEFLSRTNVVVDVGKLVWDKPGVLDAFVGFQYWRNKFGNDQDFYNRSVTPAIYQNFVGPGGRVLAGAGFAGAGAEEKTFLAGLAVHLN